MNLGDLAYPGRARRTRCTCSRSARPSRTARTRRSSTDTLISVGICDRAAERLEGEIRVLVLPALPYGVTRYGVGLPRRGRRSAKRRCARS